MNTIKANNSKKKRKAIRKFMCMCLCVCVTVQENHGLTTQLNEMQYDYKQLMEYKKDSFWP